MSLEFPVPYTEFVPRGLKKQAGGGEGSNMQWQKQTSMIIKMILALYVSYAGMYMYISKASCNYHIVNNYIYVVSNFCSAKDVFVLCCVTNSSTIDGYFVSSKASLYLDSCSTNE